MSRFSAKKRYCSKTPFYGHAQNESKTTGLLPTWYSHSAKTTIFAPPPAPQTPALRDNDWERNLNALRSRQETTHDNERTPFPDITITPPSEREHNLRDLSDIYPNTNELRPFGDKELDAAYREYLSQSVAEHNRRDSITDTEVDVLIQEDWLAAQTALQSERTRRYAHETKTVLLKSTAGESAAEAASASLGSLKNDAPVALPDVAVHVYELPDLPSPAACACYPSKN